MGGLLAAAGCLLRLAGAAGCRWQASLLSVPSQGALLSVVVASTCVLPRPRCNYCITCAC
jgi:hypothetical protein